MRVSLIAFALITCALMLSVRATLKVPIKRLSKTFSNNVNNLKFRGGMIKEKEEKDEKKKKLGILLLNLGGPKTQEDVEGFLYNLFKDPDIIRLPKLLSFLQIPIAKYIAKTRSIESRKGYEVIGGGSPILKYTNLQAKLIEDELNKVKKNKNILNKLGYDNENVKCFIGMRYWYPFTEEAIDEILKENIDQLVILPLYPQYSISTSGSSFRILKDIFLKNKNNKWLINNNKNKKNQEDNQSIIQHTTVPFWYNRDGYIKLISKLIKIELKQFTRKQIKEGGDLNVLFSAHGVPIRYIEDGDPYKRHVEECVALISKELPKNVKIHLSFQSRVGPVEWLKPFTDVKLKELGDQGVKNLVVVPISFVSEHIETLEEIDIGYQEIARESGIENWRRCPAPNTDIDFIKELSAIVLDALNKPPLSVIECLKSFDEMKKEDNE